MCRGLGGVKRKCEGGALSSLEKQRRGSVNYYILAKVSLAKLGTCDITFSEAVGGVEFRVD